MKDLAVKRWVLEGTDYVYPRTTNKILEAYLLAKGVKAEDISINYTPFGHSDWQTRVAAIKRFGAAGKKTAVVSTINGDANVPFYKELGNQKVSAEDIPVVAFSVGEEELSGLDAKPLVGHLAAWNYFQSIPGAGQQGVHQQVAGLHQEPEAHHQRSDGGALHRLQPVGAGGDQGRLDRRRPRCWRRCPASKTPNLTGGIAEMLPNHHITKPVYIGEVRADGQFDVVWKTPTTVPGDAWSDFLPGSKDLDGRLGDAEVRQLQHQDQGLLGNEVGVNRRIPGGRRAVAAYGRAARRRCSSSPRRRPRRMLLRRPRPRPFPAARRLRRRTGRTADFAGLVTSLRDAGFADKEAIVEQLVASGHASARVVLRAFLEDRLVVRAPDQGVFVATSADETQPAADLLDPVTLKPAGSSPRDALTRIGTNNRLRRVLKGLVARTDLASKDPAVRLNAVTELLRVARRPDDGAAPRAHRHRIRGARPPRDGDRPGDGRPRRRRQGGAARRHPGALAPPPARRSSTA